METVSILLCVIGIALIIRSLIKRTSSRTLLPIKSEWKAILLDQVLFYRNLNDTQKLFFEQRVAHFLNDCIITGIDTEVDDLDRIFIASSAIIPIFSFPQWQYPHLTEIVLYPNSFNGNFETAGKERTILGMVGTGFMEGKVILSKNALRTGFQNETDKKNTALHEFMHLIDKVDGSVDGIPEILLQRQYILPWIDLMEKKISEINKNRSDINSYAATNKAEFFSVVGEYFFERPDLLQKKHPVLFKQLEEMFK